jgi:hypothetical protein
MTETWESDKPFFLEHGDNVDPFDLEEAKGFYPVTNIDADCVL